MACSECDATRAQYLAMRRAILGFARTLNQLEHERLVQVDEARPVGAPSMVELRALIERDAGLEQDDLKPVREVRS
jgi:hypothetical protein